MFALVEVGRKINTDLSLYINRRGYWVWENGIKYGKHTLKRPCLRTQESSVDLME